MDVQPEPDLLAPGSTPRPSAARASAARRTIHELARQADVWEEFFDHVRVGLALADLTTRYIRVNQTYAELLGRPPEDLVGVAFSSLVHPDDRAGSDQQIAELLAGTRKALTSEERYVGEGGREVWVLHGASVVLGRDGRPGWFAISAQDITERRRAEQDLRDLTAVLAERAVRDPLTGLANRTLVEERLRGTLARDARSGGTTGLLFLDLDGFKEVNDRHGHAMGDLVLRRWRSGWSAACGPPTRWPGSAATSSSCSPRGRRGRACTPLVGPAADRADRAGDDRRPSPSRWG